jgi:general secretion pathway protein C
MKKIFTPIILVLTFFILDFTISGLYQHLVHKLDIGGYSKSKDVQLQPLEKKRFKPRAHYKNIDVRDLFKTEKSKNSKKSAPVKPVAPKPEKMKVTDLKLELKGTITGTGSDPFAVIKKKGTKRELLYTTGDAVDRAVIKAISREQVILLVDGRQEILLMKKNTSKKDGSLVKQGGANPSENSVKQEFVDNVILSWNDVTTLKTDLKNLRKKVRVRPHFYKNKMDGFRITGIKKDSVFYQKLGLRNGDIMAAVNERQIRSVNDVTNFYDGFKQLDGNVVTDVAIKRNGKPGKIRYSIE